MPICKIIVGNDYYDVGLWMGLVVGHAKRKKKIILRNAYLLQTQQGIVNRYVELISSRKKKKNLNNCRN